MEQRAGQPLVVENCIETFVGQTLLHPLDLFGGIPRDESNGELRIFARQPVPSVSEDHLRSSP
jgi:hypothetical protein